MLARELKRRFFRFIGPTSLMCVTIYFVYHMLNGDRGVLAWHQLDQKLRESHIRLSELQKTHEELERRVSLMRPDSFCLDMLDEQSKLNLGYVSPDEVVVMRGNESLDLNLQNDSDQR